MQQCYKPLKSGASWDLLVLLLINLVLLSPIKSKPTLGHGTEKKGQVTTVLVNYLKSD